MDSPSTVLSSQDTSPDSTGDGGDKVQTRSDTSQRSRDDQDSAIEPAQKKCKLNAPSNGDLVSVSDKECQRPSLQINRTSFVENLVVAAVSTISCIWGRFSRESRREKRQDASCNNTLPLDLFVREILRRSRTNCSTLQAALLYCHRCKQAVESSVDKMADTADAIDCKDQSKAKSARFPSLEAYSPWNATSQVKPTANGSAPSVSPLLCGRRMFLASIVVAYKFLQDQTYSNRTWSKISGLAPREIEHLERVFLHTIRYDLTVNAAQWTQWTSRLSSNWSHLEHNLMKSDPSPLSHIQPTGSRQSVAERRMQRANSENVIGQTLPYDASLLDSERARDATTKRTRRPYSA
ncbi:PHO85 cyclin-5 [Malassezia yamatoensis]|uniref:PHO85 cyclin-5 n=1 Tax=Malassezia yamatoensis TaxID=253288 RepID=A0AAJ5YWM9_9BASI|nr:PHO85 cyclin-5 [Malassezia yamatoensis]